MAKLNPNIKDKVFIEKSLEENINYKPTLDEENGYIDDFYLTNEKNEELKDLRKDKIEKSIAEATDGNIVGDLSIGIDPNKKHELLITKDVLNVNKSDKEIGTDGYLESNKYNEETQNHTSPQTKILSSDESLYINKLVKDGEIERIDITLPTKVTTAIADYTVINDAIELSEETFERTEDEENDKLKYSKLTKTLTKTRIVDHEDKTEEITVNSFAITSPDFNIEKIEKGNSSYEQTKNYSTNEKETISYDYDNAHIEITQIRSAISSDTSSDTIKRFRTNDNKLSLKNKDILALKRDGQDLDYRDRVSRVRDVTDYIGWDKAQPETYNEDENSDYDSFYKNRSVKDEFERIREEIISLDDNNIYEDYDVVIHNDTRLEGNLSIQGNTQIDKNLNVTQNTNIEQDLNVEGNTNINKHLNVKNGTTLSYINNEELKTQLDLTEDGISIIGETNFKSPVNFEDNANFEKPVHFDSIDGNYFKSNSEGKGFELWNKENDETVNSLTVSYGISNLKETKINGNVTINGANNNTIINSHLIVNGANNTINNTLTGSSFKSITNTDEVDNNVAFTIWDNVDDEDTLALKVEGKSNFTDSVKIDNNLQVYQKATFNEGLEDDDNNNSTLFNLEVRNKLETESINPNKESVLNIGTEENKESNLNVYGNTLLNGELIVTNDTVLEGELTVEKLSSFENGIKTDVISKFSDDLDSTIITNTLDVDGNLNVEENTTIKGNLEVKGTTKIEEATTLNDTLQVEKATTLKNTLLVNNDTTINKNLIVEEVSTLKNGVVTPMISSTETDEWVELNGNLEIKTDLLVKENTKIKNNLYLSNEKTVYKDKGESNLPLINLGNDNVNAFNNLEEQLILNSLDRPFVNWVKEGSITEEDLAVYSDIENLEDYSNETFVKRLTSYNEIDDTYQEQILKTSLNLAGNLVIDGDLIVYGDKHEMHTTEIYSSNDYIYLREGTVSGLGDNTYTGIEAIKYDGQNNGRLVFDNKGYARVGDVGDEKKLAVIEEESTANKFVRFNGSTYELETDEIELTDLQSTVQTSSNSILKVVNAGSAPIWGKLDLTKDIDNSTTLPIERLLGTLPVNQGGTGLTTLTQNQVLIGNGQSNITFREIVDEAIEGSNKILSAGGAFTELAKKQNVLDSTNILPVTAGGTGNNILMEGYALIGNGTNNVAFRQITNNTNATTLVARTNLINENTLIHSLPTINNNDKKELGSKVYYAPITQGLSSQALVGNDSGANPIWREITHISSYNTNLLANDTLVTLSTLEYIVPKINTTTSSIGIRPSQIYAPTVKGNQDDILISNGTLPQWKSWSDIKVGSAVKFDQALTIIAAEWNNGNKPNLEDVAEEYEKSDISFNVAFNGNEEIIIGEMKLKDIAVEYSLVPILEDTPDDIYDNPISLLSEVYTDNKGRVSHVEKVLTQIPAQRLTVTGTGNTVTSLTQDGIHFTATKDDRVDLVTNQSINGIKTFEERTRFHEDISMINGYGDEMANFSNYDSSGLLITSSFNDINNGGGNVKINTRYINLSTEDNGFKNGSITIQSPLIKPFITNYTDLGTSSLLFKNLYLSGKINNLTLPNKTGTLSTLDDIPETAKSVENKHDLTSLNIWKGTKDEHELLTDDIKNNGQYLFFIDDNLEGIVIKTTLSLEDYNPTDLIEGVA